MIDTDHQVTKLRPYATIDVIFSGKPDPGIAKLKHIKSKDTDFLDVLQRQGLMPELSKDPAQARTDGAGAA